jgi:hypothetical protein
MKAVLWIIALALLLVGGGACASREAGTSPEALARATSTQNLQRTIALDKARLIELISTPGEEFGISFTQSPELIEIAERLPAFQGALRAREAALGNKATR